MKTRQIDGDDQFYSVFENFEFELEKKFITSREQNTSNFRSFVEASNFRAIQEMLSKVNDWITNLLKMDLDPSEFDGKYFQKHYKYVNEVNIALFKINVLKNFFISDER